MKKLSSNKLNTAIILIIFATTIALCSSLSVTNTSKYFSTDVSVWLNVAKMMDSGKIIYKDIFDHKGPIIYFLYFIGYKLGDTWGIWLIHYVTVLIDTFVIYNICERVLKNKKKSIMIVGICMLFLVSIMNFYSESPCTESIALPFILISLYQFMKFNANNNKFGKMESLITGFCLGIVLLLRPNVISLWIVYDLYIFIKCIKQKEINKLLKIIVFSLIGVTITIAPIILYLSENNALEDFINTYLIFNFKYANIKENGLLDTIYYFIIRNNIIIGVFGIYIFNFLYTKKHKESKNELLIVNFIYFIITILLVILPQRLYLHYAIIILPCLIYPIIVFIKNIKINKKIYIIYMMFALVILISISILTPIIWGRKKESENYFEYKNYIQSNTTKEDNILILGNETYMYIYLDRQYKGKYFYQMPIALCNEEIAKDIIEEIKNNLPEIIINYYLEYDIDNNYIESKYDKELKKILEQYYTTENQIIYTKTEE